MSEAWFETQTCIILSHIQTHLTLHFVSNIQKYVRQKYKDLQLVKGTLNECEVNSKASIQYFHTLMRNKIITIDVGAGQAEDKRDPVHYWSFSYWRLPLQQRCNPIMASEWITDMPCIQIDRAKGGWCQQIALILYLCLMNICGTMAANLSRLYKGGRKIILW